MQEQIRGVCREWWWRIRLAAGSTSGVRGSEKICNRSNLLWKMPDCHAETGKVESKFSV